MTASPEHVQRAADTALLRRYEPILRFTKGELFFPMDVSLFVRHASLWMQKPSYKPVCLIPTGQLTLESLRTVELTESDNFDSVYFMRFVDDTAVADIDVTALRHNLARERGFRPGRGRLARVGYTSRFIDALFATTLLARGRVPGDTAVGASLAYEKLVGHQPQYHYYGRVVRQNGWLVLQYWYFYAFNNWRSGFKGVNDHEADWEMICLYLDENQSDTADPQPEWVAYATHDSHGDDLRRRWDDPELEKIDEHPIVYVGAGSHAGYFQAGEYMTEVVLPFLTPFVRLADQQQKFWRSLLRQYQPEGFQIPARPSFNLFRVPFIDYARGDGIAIGPYQNHPWQPPQLLDQTATWATQYRGLWGLYTRDPISGEDAPAGPVYNRDGTVRLAWYDPVSWAGLSKVAPPSQLLARTRARREHLAAVQKELRHTIDEKQEELLGLSVEAAPMRGLPHLKEVYQTHQERIASLTAELEQRRAERVANAVLLETLDQHLPTLAQNATGSMRGHLHRPNRPFSPEALRFDRLVELWAAISIGLVMLAYVLLIFFAPANVWRGMLILVILMITIEAVFRHRLQSLIKGLTNLLTAVAALLLIYQFWFPMLVIGLLLLGGYVTWQNLREFFH